VNINNRAYFIAATVFLFLFLLLANNSSAAEPTFLLTWSTKSYVPAVYSGKALPTAGSEIHASLQVINQNKAVDISAQTIYWYVDGNLVSNKPGVQDITFHAPAFAPGVIDVKVQLPSYPSSNNIAEEAIPVVQPEAVIVAPYPGGIFYGGTAEATAYPYFFNVNSLNFTWSVNGQTPSSSDSPQTLSVNTDPNAPVGSTLLLALDISNPSNQNESAIKYLNLIMSK